LWSMCWLGPAISQPLIFAPCTPSKGGQLHPIYADAEVFHMSSNWMKRLNAFRGYLYSAAAIAIRIAW
jgi:hypothetical protein